MFNTKVEAEGKPVTNQKNSGRCWIFAALNVMRYSPQLRFSVFDDFLVFAATFSPYPPLVIFHGFASFI